MSLRPNHALDAAFAGDSKPLALPSGPLRKNNLLDDVFGLSPAKWAGEEPPKVEPPKPPAPKPAPAQVVQDAPARQARPAVDAKPVTVPKPAPAAKPEGKRVTFWTPPPEDNRPLLPPVTRVPVTRPLRVPLWMEEFTELSLPELLAAELVTAEIVPAATFLERPGEDLLYVWGHWLHRCNHCGDCETVLVPKPGRNPRTETRNVFTVPLTTPIRHEDGCPWQGTF